MYEKQEPLKFATLFANVSDLDAVLHELYSRLKLAPFLRFELDEHHEITPIALIRMGDHILELLGRTQGKRPETGVICCVDIDAPIHENIEFEPAPGMKLRCQPGETFNIRSLEIVTAMPKEDTAAYIDYLGATMDKPDSPLELTGVGLQLTGAEGLPPEETPGLFFPGWHRMSVYVPSAIESYDSMTASGSTLERLVDPFQVMPGLREAMLLLPSKLILQITEESLLKMTPSLLLEWVRSKFSGHRMRFTTKDVAA
jgi:hypothetical protein